MARIRTHSEITNAEILSLKNSLAVTLRNTLAKELGRTPEEINVRDAMPSTDFGLGTEVWDNNSSLTTGTWTNDWSKALPKNKRVVFYGVFNRTDDPTVIGVKFKEGASGQTTRDVVMLERMNGEEIVKCFFDPIEYKPNATVYIELLQISGSAVAAGGELIGYFALVAEPYGEVVSAPQK